MRRPHDRGLPGVFVGKCLVVMISEENVECGRRS